MIAMVLFSAVAAALVYHAGRKDAARDPRLTGVVLALLAGFPLLAAAMPKMAVLPPGVGGGVESGFSWATSALWIWALGFGAAMLRLAISAGFLVGWYRRSQRIDRIGRIEIRRLESLKGPVAAGVFRPVIFVPEAWGRWPESVRRIVLEHELAHHHRRDPLWRWVAEIAGAMNWFNPLAWWMVRRLALQCECACDARVLQRGIAASDYAGLLCDLAENAPRHRPAMAMAERSSLERRVSRMMANRNSRRTAGAPAMIFFAVFAALALAGLGGSSGNRKVSPVPADEVELRWSADPFPARHPN